MNFVLKPLLRALPRPIVFVASGLLLLAPAQNVGAREATDPEILDIGWAQLRVGIASTMETFQIELGRALQACHRNARRALPPGDRRGLLTRATAERIEALARCNPGNAIPATSSAHRGALTEAVWRVAMKNTPLPDLADKTQLLTLSFEGTDFADAPEWNFCQDTQGNAATRPDRVRAGAPCINRSDPCSMLTWGPRGATVGQGRELQWILNMVQRRHPQLLADAFGKEASQLPRFLTLQGPPVESCDGSSALEGFMCAIWVDRNRRETWQSALTRLGQNADVRSLYNRLYASIGFDGYKLQEYVQLWRALSLHPSEIDYAFFMDRATHIGAPPQDLRQTRDRLDRCMAGMSYTRNRNATARRCLSRLHSHPSVPALRLGRDVVYYVDEIGLNHLTKEEKSDWNAYIPIGMRSHLKLSDQREVPAALLLSFELAKEDISVADSADLTTAERQCAERLQ